jgi:hypothetical protein
MDSHQPVRKQPTHPLSRYVVRRGKGVSPRGERDGPRKGFTGLRAQERQQGRGIRERKLFNIQWSGISDGKLFLLGKLLGLSRRLDAGIAHPRWKTPAQALAKVLPAGHGLA